MKSYCLSVACLATAFMLGETVLAEEKPLKVFVLAGQSNMAGRLAKLSELPDDLKGEQKEAFFFNGQRWIPLTPGKTESRGFGPEIPFAHRMTEKLGEPVGIIKFARGGSNLAEQWSPTNPESFYVRLLGMVEAAQKSRKIKVVGMLWMQGERDAKLRKMAEAYAENLAKFILAARNDYKNPELFFVAGRVNPPKRKFPFVDAVRKAQEECKAPHYALINCDTLKKGPDNVHYATQGYIDMGTKFADAMLKLMEKTKPRETRQGEQ